MAPILIISGTSRPQANALRVAGVLERHYRQVGVPAETFSLAELPAEVFRPEAYATKPAGFLPIQQRVLEARGLHLVVPEYNGSFPGVLKHFIDMLKFPESFDRKCVAFVGEASGIHGAVRAVEQLQIVFGYRNAFIFPVRVFVGAVGRQFDESGRLVNEEIDQRLAKQALEFSRFIACIGGVIRG